MTQQEIEFNKRCVEFLGYKFKYYTDDRSKETSDVRYVWGSEAEIFRICKNWWRCSKTPSNSSSWHFPTDLHFHSDWNLIMEVVEAIEELGSCKLAKGNFKISRTGIIFYFSYKGKDLLHLELRPYINDDVFKHPMYEHHIIKQFDFKNRSKKEAVVEAINEFLIWHEKNNE